MTTQTARVFNANEFTHVGSVDDHASGNENGDPLYCQLHAQFVGQATRNRAHLAIAGTSGFGVAASAALFRGPPAPPAKKVAKYTAPEPHAASAAYRRIVNPSTGYQAACPHKHAACHIPACRTRKL
jgi:hypothetical protein